MEITGAIFDFDGTLFDSMHIWKNISINHLKHLGIAPTQSDISAFKGLFLRDSLLLTKEKFNLKMTYEELFKDFFEYLKNRYRNEAVPKNDIVKFLEKLKKRNVKMSIATASEESAVLAALEKYSMSHYFDSIYSTYTVNAEKTRPDVYRTALKSLGTDKKNTWIFEDALYAAKTAKADGFKIVGVYDKSEKKADKLKELADIYIHTYDEIKL